MAFQVPTYSQRVNRIRTVDNLDNELAGAKRYMMRLRSATQKAATQAERTVIAESLAKAESVLRRLRQNYFDIEESLVETE